MPMAAARATTWQVIMSGDSRFASRLCFFPADAVTAETFRQWAAP